MKKVIWELTLYCDSGQIAKDSIMASKINVDISES